MCFSFKKKKIFREKITKKNLLKKHLKSSNFLQLQRLLSSQMFYFSSLQSYDLTRSAQHRDSHDCSDARFFWNRSLHFSFQRYGIDTDNWLLKCMAG